MANPKAEPRLHEYTLKNGTKVYGFTVDRVVMPSEWAAVKQEELGLADLDTPEGTSLEQEPQPRLHEYTLKNGTKVFGFTVDRVAW